MNPNDENFLKNLEQLVALEKATRDKINKLQKRLNDLNQPHKHSARPEQSLSKNTTRPRIITGRVRERFFQWAPEAFDEQK